MGSGTSGLTLSRPLRLDNKPVTRVENICATGSEALRNACYAVASGAYDMAMAVGVEKLKDSGFSGLVAPHDPGRRDRPRHSPPRPAFSLLPGLRQEVRRRRQRTARTSWPASPGRTTPTARATRGPSSARRSSKDTICAAPLIAGALGVFDCCGVSDGCAAAIVVRAEDAHRYTDKPLYMKGLSFVAGPATRQQRPGLRLHDVPRSRRRAADAYAQAGVTDPRAQLAMAEVHDCFTPTELVLMEDLGFAERGFGWKEVLAGTFDLTASCRSTPTAGSRRSAIRSARAAAHDVRVLAAAAGRGSPERRIATVGQGRNLALTHNLGGRPGECVSFVSVVGSEPSA